MMRKRILALFLSVLTLFGLVSCGGGQGPASSKNSELNQKSVGELQEMIRELQAEESAILQENGALWKTVMEAVNESNSTLELKEEFNYGAQLLAGIDATAEKFSEEELETLRQGAEKIRDIETKLRPILARYDELLANGVGKPSDDSQQTFPTFEGTDLDGNAVDSSVISNHAFTILNFWFTTCVPCVEELEELEDISQDAKEKGGVLLGVNAFTQAGDTQAIEEAKAVLAAKGVTYQNLCFASGSDAGKFTEQLFTFPSTYVLNRSGKIMGDPVIGSITTAEQKEKLYKLIDAALEEDAAQSASGGEKN